MRRARLEIRLPLSSQLGTVAAGVHGVYFLVVELAAADTEPAGVPMVVEFLFLPLFGIFVAEDLHAAFLDSNSAVVDALATCHTAILSPYIVAAALSCCGPEIELFALSG